MYESKAACIACHGANGAGLPNLGPPLRNSEWLTGDADRLTRLLLHGLTGPITVAGKVYNPPLDMPGINANPSIQDADIADLLIFLRNSWGHSQPSPLASQITKVRKQTADRFLPYKESDLR